MCGRFKLDIEISELIRGYKIEDNRVDQSPSGDYFPSSKAPMVFNDWARAMKSAHWGFEFNGKKSVINARAETVETKPMFKESFKIRRSIIPASLFYEWKQISDGNKVKYKINSDENKVLSLGAIYRISSDGEMSFVIITTQAGPDMKSIHHRMPLIINPEKIDIWLDRNSDSKCILDIIQSNRSHRLNVKLSNGNSNGNGGRCEQISMF